MLGTGGDERIVGGREVDEAETSKVSVAEKKSIISHDDWGRGVLIFSFSFSFSCDDEETAVTVSILGQVAMVVDLFE